MNDKGHPDGKRFVRWRHWPRWIRVALTVVLVLAGAALLYYAAFMVYISCCFQWSNEV